MNLTDLNDISSLPRQMPRLISGTQGDYVSDQVVALIEYCWASGLTVGITVQRTHCEQRFVRRIFVKCDQALIKRANEQRQELLDA
jgi:hypothetical protein